MNREEFYRQVAAWSIHRRKLDTINRELTQRMLVIQRCKDTNIDYTQDDLDTINSLKNERHRLEFMLEGIIDTLDTEVDRVEEILKKQRETAQISNQN